MEYYDLGKDIIAFTTDRNQGRDRDLIIQELNNSNLLFPNTSSLLPKKFIYPHQTHTANVIKIDEDILALPEASLKDYLEGKDAVISNVKDVIFGISTADCIPVLVYDPVHHAAAAIHAGWRGTVQRIVEKAVARMQEEYGTVTSDCRAVIGPGISQDSFEVGWEVHQAFADAGFDMDSVTVVMPSRDGNGTKPHLDLKEINRQQLLACGVSAANIQVSGIDTFTDDRFFSARREQTGTVKCGRILSGFFIY